MKQVFICEICGETFDSARDASDCERSHWNIDRDKIEEIDFRAYDAGYDSIMYLLVPCKRENIDGTEDSCKMKFRLEGFVEKEQE